MLTLVVDENQVDPVVVFEWIRHSSASPLIGRRAGTSGSTESPTRLGNPLIAGISGGSAPTAVARHVRPTAHPVTGGSHADSPPGAGPACHGGLREPAAGGYERTAPAPHFLVGPY